MLRPRLHVMPVGLGGPRVPAFAVACLRRIRRTAAVRPMRAHRLEGLDDAQVDSKREPTLCEAPAEPKYVRLSPVRELSGGRSDEGVAGIAREDGQAEVDTGIWGEGNHMSHGTSMIVESDATAKRVHEVSLHSQLAELDQRLERTRPEFGVAEADALHALASEGIDCRLLTVEGRSPGDPVADNGTVEGRQASRRVEVTLIPSPS